MTFCSKCSLHKTDDNQLPAEIQHFCDSVNIKMDIDANYDEEEYYVYIDFENSLTSAEIDDPHLDVKIIGIDSENPIMEVNGKIFKGNYDYPYCTNVLFEKNEQPPHMDPIYEKVPEKFYRLVGKTNKQITMKRIFLESEDKVAENTSEKELANQDSQEESLEELKKRLELFSSYEDALNLFLPPGKCPPRKIDSENFQSSTSHKIDIKNPAEICEYVEDGDDEVKDPNFDPYEKS